MDIFSPNKNPDTTKAPKKSSRLPMYLLLAVVCAGVQSDVHQKFEAWTRNCDDTHLLDKNSQNEDSDESMVPIDGFSADPSITVDQSEWPECATNPLSKIRPTFDDGPHPNDLKLVDTLDDYPFETPIFYYNGLNFFSEETLNELGINPKTIDAPDSNWKISPGKWIKWLENGAKVTPEMKEQDPEKYQQSIWNFLKTKLDPAKMAIAKTVHDAGYTIGFHGMVHAKEDNPFHLKNLDTDQFKDEIAAFELIVRTSIEDDRYSLKNVRPPYGGGTHNLFSPDFVEYCEENGIDVRNWALSSFDWEVDDKRGERLLADSLRIGASGKFPDILFHSNQQDGTTKGNFGKMLAAWNGHVLSLLSPEREDEIETYRDILENILSNTPENIHAELESSAFPIGSSGQIAVDSAYNVELETQYMGALQTKLGVKADGYIGDSVVDRVSRLAPASSTHMTRIEIARTLKDPSTFAGSRLRDELQGITGNNFEHYPDSESLMESNVTFANRGLQVRYIATDILCQLQNGNFDESFLAKYRPNGLYIDPDRIPVYVKMFNFLKGSKVDDQTTARVIATSLIKTGLKNTLDKFGIGKGTVEVLGEAMNYVFDGDTFVPGIVRTLGGKKQADVMQYGLGLVGPGQVPRSISHVMYEAILGRNLTRIEVEKILNSPEGAAFAIYLYQRQYEERLRSSTW